MWMIDYREMSWWYWTVTAALLLSSLAFWPPALWLTIALSAAQTVHFGLREHGIRAFPVQVRLSYTLMLLVCLWEPLNMLLWIPAIGTLAQVLVGYCALARCLSLPPWNRQTPFSLQLLLKTFLSPPVKGSVLQGLPANR